MGFAGKNWNNIDPTNERPFTYDFKDRLPDLDRIVSVTWELKVVPDGEYRGVDPDVLTRLINASFDDTTATIWTAPGCIAMTRYRLTAFVVTSYGIHDDLWAYVKCDPTP